MEPPQKEKSSGRISFKTLALCAGIAMVILYLFKRINRMEKTLIRVDSQSQSLDTTLINLQKNNEQEKEKKEKSKSIKDLEKFVEQKKQNQATENLMTSVMENISKQWEERFNEIQNDIKENKKQKSPLLARQFIPENPIKEEDVKEYVNQMGAMSNIAAILSMNNIYSNECGMEFCTESSLHKSQNNLPNIVMMSGDMLPDHVDQLLKKKIDDTIITLRGVPTTEHKTAEERGEDEGPQIEQLPDHAYKN